MRWLFYYNLLYGNHNHNNSINYDNINEGLSGLSDWIIIIGIIMFILFCLSWSYYGIVCLKDYISDNYKNKKQKKYISQDELLEKINKWKNEKDKERNE